MKMLVAALALVVMTGAANAGINDATWNPPARYDGPYTGTVVKRYMPQWDILKECTHLGGDYHGRKNLRGCAKRIRKDFCIVVISIKTYKKATPSAILRHELGHCKGWPGNHPN